MIYALKGKVAFVNLTSVILNVNNVFYELLVTDQQGYELNEEVFIYTYQVVREDAEYLIGFRTLDAKVLFKHLISVSGIGPKTALGILAATTPARLEEAIETEDLKYLKKLPGLGQKGASQIILDLKGKLVNKDVEKNTSVEDEVEQALLSLGFKKADIKKVIKKVNDHNLSAEELLKKALSEFRK